MSNQPKLCQSEHQTSPLPPPCSEILQLPLRFSSDSCQNPGRVGGSSGRTTSVDVWRSGISHSGLCCHWSAHKVQWFCHMLLVEEWIVELFQHCTFLLPILSQEGVNLALLGAGVGSSGSNSPVLSFGFRYSWISWNKNWEGTSEHFFKF